MADYVGLLVFVVVIGSILINFLIANEFDSIAKQKGHFNQKYFWYCFFLGIIGCLMVIALPNISSKAKTNSDELPEI